jgi:methionyl aminopeptidase
LALIKNKKEIEILRGCGKKLAKILASIIREARPGISTYDLDKVGEELIIRSGGTPSFKGYRIKETRIPYPCSLCTSINDEVVHAIPRKNIILKEGDIIGLDIGMLWPAKDGLYTDMAVTVGVGEISSEAKRLIQGTKEALEIGIASVWSGVKVGDIGFAIQTHLEKYGFGIIRDLAGHGVGHEVHEPPLIPNFGRPGTGAEILEGMVIAIEPMATLGGWKVELDDDDWTFRTADGSLSAHFEHTVAVTEDGAEVLTML